MPLLEQNNRNSFGHYMSENVQAVVIYGMITL